MVVFWWSRASDQELSDRYMEVVLLVPEHLDHDDILKHDFRAGRLFIAKDASIHLDCL